MVFQTGTLPRHQQLNTLNEIIQHIEQYLEKIAIPEHPALKQNSYHYCSNGLCTCLT